jgi:putative endonuclease
MYIVYLLQCFDKSIYTGITTNVKRRFSEHKNKKGGHYTASHNVESIVHTEQYRTRSEALKREAQIKKWPRERKLELAIRHIIK